MERFAASKRAGIGRVLASLAFALTLASCSATGVPSVDIAATGFAANAPVPLAPDVAAAEGDAGGAAAASGDLPQSVAFRPSANPLRPPEAAIAAATGDAKSQPATVADAIAQNPAAPVPQPTANGAQPAPETEIRLAAVEQPQQSLAEAEELALAPTPRPEAVLTANRSGEAVFENAAPAQPAKKRGGLFASFFGAPKPAAAATTKAARRLPAEEAAPVVLASAGPAQGQSLREALTGAELPGVRKSALFEITRKNGIDDDSDVDLTEDNEPMVRIASAAGLARLAPNGLLVQHEGVDTACLRPALVKTLRQIERHYGKRVVVTSGYRSPSHNKRVRGARKSLHMACAAADIQISGVGKWELARYARTMAGRGGVGTYCHTESVHIDVGPERDWNWRCRRSKRG